MGPTLGPMAWWVEGLPLAGTLVQETTWETAQGGPDLQCLPTGLRTNTQLLPGDPEVLHNVTPVYFCMLFPPPSLFPPHCTPSSIQSAQFSIPL